MSDTNSPSAPLTVSQGIVRFLEAQGIARVYGVPGESYLGVLDALYDSDIDFINARQEGGAAMMAEASGKLTGRPGVCMVTRGPGATNASAGVHIAQQDSTPMLLFVGQIARDFVGRDAFQELDYKQFFGGMAKAVLTLDRASRTIELMSRAWSLAMSGRPGPVVIELPEDVLGEVIDASGSCLSKNLRRPNPLTPALAIDQAADLVNMLNQAERPIAIVGDTGSLHGDEQAHMMLDRLGMPVVASFRRQGHAGPWLKNYAGDLGLGANPRLVTRVQQSDLVLLLNAPVSEIPSQGFTWAPGANGQRVVQILPSADELGRWYTADFAMVGSPAAILSALVNQPFAPREGWDAWTEEARQDFVNWAQSTPSNPGSVQMVDLVRALQRRLPEAIMCNGAGNYASWLHRFWPYRPGGQLAPTSGSMGYGLPAAIAAALEKPDRDVVCWAGDGCLQMTIQELATAAERRLPILVLVIDNGMYGTIRMHQERHFPARVSGTSINNPDFSKVAAGYGWHVEKVTQTEAFEPALAASQEHCGPSLIHVMLDPEAITPTKTLSDIRANS